MGKDAQVLIRVEEETKKEWQRAAEEKGFRGLSGFIRFAVNNEIEGRDDNGSVGDTDAFADVRDDVVDSVGDHHQAVIGRLGAIEAAVSGIQSELDDGVDVGQGIVVEALPALDESEYLTDGTKGRLDPEAPDIPSKMYKDAVGPETVAREIGAPTDPVRRTLERLAMKSERVQFLRGSREDHDERRYYLDA
jgi:hypothetical protein